MKYVRTFKTNKQINKQKIKNFGSFVSPASPQLLMQMRAKHKSKVASKMDLPATDYWLPVFDAAIESVRLINFIFHINNIHVKLTKPSGWSIHGTLFLARQLSYY